LANGVHLASFRGKHVREKCGPLQRGSSHNPNCKGLEEPW
jgi:hypothetical protein